MIQGAVHSLLALSILLLNSGCAPSIPAPRDVSDSAPLAWGTFDGMHGKKDGELKSPSGIAFGSDRSMYVAVYRRIQVFDQYGSYLRQWPVDAYFTGIGTDGSDNFYIPIWDGYVVKYDRLGNEILRWPLRGKSAAEYPSPAHIAVDPIRNRVYVVDVDDQSIQLFDCGGLFLERWDAFPADGIALDVHGDIYLTGNGVIRKISQAGGPLKKLQHSGHDCGGLKFPTGLAVDLDGNIIIADTGTHTIHKLGPDGQPLVCWGALGSDAGEFCDPRNVAVANDKSIYVSDGGLNRRIQRFTPEGGFIEQFGKAAPPCESFLWPAFISIGDDGRVYVVDGNHIQIFDTNGTPLACWGGLGRSLGELNEASGIVAHGGRVYVVDSRNARIQVFDGRGEVVGVWGRQGEAEGEFDCPRGIAVDHNGRVFVVDYGNRRVQVFEPDGAFLRAFPIPEQSHGIAVDEAGGIYVTSRSTHPVRKYDYDGNLVLEWGKGGSGDGEFDGASGVAIGSDGSIYIADFENSRIQKFDSDGTFIAKWGRAGTKVGELYRPRGVVCWGDYVFIADSNNGRVQRIHSSYWKTNAEEPEGPR